MSDPQKKVAADVKAHGWHVVKVFCRPDEGPSFAYTIGLETTFDHPEVIIFGLNDDLDFMHVVLNDIGARIAMGERFEHGAIKEGILPGYVCPFARFPRSAYDEHLGQAIVFHGSSAFRAVQCIWPDPEKYLPWDSDVVPGTLERQPVFLRPEAGPDEPAWPFVQSHSHPAITTQQVVRGEEPIRHVARSDDGEWEFICLTTSESDDAVRTTLGWVFDHDPSVSAVAALGPGEALRRGHRAAVWEPARDDS